MLIGHQVTNYLTNHSKLCKSCQFNNQSCWISVYRLRDVT